MISGTQNNKWYLSSLAGAYLILCGISSIRYLAMDMSLIPGHVPVFTQVLCFAATIAAALYFFRPMMGCMGLAIVTLLALNQAAIARNPTAVVFHVIILLVLSVSVLGFLRRPRPA